ncbi:MAG: hypothetical protein IJP07_07445 [Firmicutes bacterium]|nr:hypothetical protein [Bacillota bacterium]
MKSKTILLLILCCLLLSACGQEAPQPEGENPAQTEESPAPSREYSINEPYEYPIRPGMPEWAELDGLPQMGTACRIPVDILLNMSTEALVETVMDYPLLWNILAYDSPAAGVESVESYFNGLPALYGRADGLSAFRENYEALSALIDSGELPEEEATVARLNLRTAGFILERMEELDARAAEWAAQGNVEQESSYSLERIPFSVPEGLSLDQRLDVLDADRTRLLYSIRENVNTGSIYPPMNQKLGLYSLESGEILLELPLPDSQTLQSAALLPEGFVFFQNEGRNLQLIRVDAAGQSSQLDSGRYYMIKNEPPEFALLEDGTLLYSYQKQVEEELFRAVLRAVDGEGRVRTLLELDQKKEDWDDPQPSRLISNGRDYIFFLQKEKSFFRGSIDTPPEEYRLKAGQLLAGELLADGGIFRLHDWAAGYWAENMLCLDMEAQHSSEEQELNHAFLLEELCGNGKDQILGLDPEMKQIYALTVRDGLIQKELLRHEALPQGMSVRFFNLSEDSYLLDYPQADLIYLLRFLPTE